ncbi:MAG: hypothetical protein G3M70_12285 [Candidatus Nitronauta litoralis]|uniref:Uncharacterized protein n=1 Tax=Candidatus Nitronauta litoralis TaxID=2705533 RepID=A0A7T0BXE0_9BACT|nr:MAG: hypothetical protein G3M70_12285 [Candidatus Nitronauta litoralis]
MIMFSLLFCVLIYEVEAAGNLALLNETHGAGQLLFTGIASRTPDLESESI